MENDLVTFLLIDLECTCNDEPPLPNEQMEIIEIGAALGVLKADSFKLLDERQIYVQPQWHALLSRFCVELTGIQQLQVDQAPSLKEAISILSAWLARYEVNAWGSWGKFDQRHVSSETRLKELQNPLEPLRHINIKQLFARKRGHRVGLARAVQLSGLEFQGRHHSGVDDARNIAQLLELDRILREAILARL